MRRRLLASLLSIVLAVLAQDKHKPERRENGAMRPVRRASAFIIAIIIVQALSGCGLRPIIRYTSRVGAPKEIWSKADITVSFNQDNIHEAFRNAETQESITEAIRRDLQQNLFSYGEKTLTIDVRIEKLVWKERIRWLMILPPFSFFAFLGVPIAEYTGEADISLMIYYYDNGVLLGTYDSQQVFAKKVNMRENDYYDKSRNGGCTGIALVMAMEDIKRQIIRDKSSIVQVGGREAPSHERKPAPEPRIAEVVSITGAVGSIEHLTTGGPAEEMPNLSPDGRWLLVNVSEVGPEASSNHVLSKIDLSSLAAKVILSPKDSDNRNGDWMPDMRSIVFVTRRLGPSTLCQSLGISGQMGVRFITLESLGNVDFPSVSPDGEEIAFCIAGPSEETQKADLQIAVIQHDGLNLRVLGPGRTPRWSPDGQTVLFTRRVGNYDHIYTMDARTSRNLTELTSGESNEYAPDWSPDGEYIAFTSDRVGERPHLFIMRANGQDVTQLTVGDFDCRNARWERDGFIYFSANAGDNWDIWRLRPILLE